LFLAAGSAGASGAYNNLIQIDNSDASHPAILTGSLVSHDATNDPVQNANLAYSHSVNCTGCKTITVAVQAVIIEGNPTNISPQNAAVALNENCQSCQTFAYAHQYVFSPHHPVTLSERTNQQLQQIQQGIDWVAHSGKDFATMSSQLDDLSWAYCYVVQRAAHVTNVCGAPPFDHRQVQEHN
jgi:hypothetical protein